MLTQDGSTGLGPVPTTDGSGNAPVDNTPSPVSNIIAADALSDGSDIDSTSNGEVTSAWYWYIGAAVVAMGVIGGVIGGLVYTQKKAAAAVLSVNNGVDGGSNHKVTAMDSDEIEIGHSVTPSAVLSVDETGVDFAGESYCE